MENSEPKPVPELEPITLEERSESNERRATPGAMYRRAEMRAHAESLALAGALVEAPAELPVGTLGLPPPDMAAALGQLDPVVRAIAPLAAAPQPVVGRPSTPRRAIASRGPVSLRRRRVALATAVAAIVTAAWLARPDPPTSLSSSSSRPEVTYSAPVSSTAASSAASQPATVQPLPATPSLPVAQPQPRAVISEPVLRVASDPPGARVTVDGVGWGITPVTIRNLPAGMKRVRATKDGYVADERVVSMSSGSGTSIQLRLRRRPGSPPVSTATTRQRR